MTEESPSPIPRASAGALLREARQAQGLHIAALAASIKVAQRKLEALEADRFEELPDTTFTRALAQTVCRALKIDPVPILALLPAHIGHRLEHVGGGINEPFRERPGRHEPKDWATLASPAVWGPLLLVVGAAALYFWPASWLPALPFGLSAPAPVVADDAASAASAATSLPHPLLVETETAPSSGGAASDAAGPASAPTPAASVPVAAALPGNAILQVRTSAPSWIEVRDARSRVIESRLVQAGESLAMDGEAPLRLKIGNARATEVVFRGRPLDLAGSTHNNIAQLELK